MMKSILLLYSMSTVHSLRLHSTVNNTTDNTININVSNGVTVTGDINVWQRPLDCHPGAKPVETADVAVQTEEEADKWSTPGQKLCDSAAVAEPLTLQEIRTKRIERFEPLLKLENDTADEVSDSDRNANESQEQEPEAHEMTDDDWALNLSGVAALFEEAASDSSDNSSSSDDSGSVTANEGDEAQNIQETVQVTTSNDEKSEDSAEETTGNDTVENEAVSRPGEVAVEDAGLKLRRGWKKEGESWYHDHFGGSSTFPGEDTKIEDIVNNLEALRKQRVICAQAIISKKDPMSHDMTRYQMAEVGVKPYDERSGRVWQILKGLGNKVVKTLGSEERMIQASKNRRYQKCLNTIAKAFDPELREIGVNENTHQLAKRLLREETE